MNEIDKRLEDFEIEIMSKNVSNDMVKEDNIECCVCMEFHWGVKLPNCNHFICPKCYYNLYYGFVSDRFYTNNSRPIHPEKLTYPYVNISQNLEIYNNLTEDETYMDWFINDNEDLYNCIKVKSEFVDNINNNILQWFENNELIIKYENDLLQYELNYKKYIDKNDIYLKLLEEEKENNTKKICPLCRL